MPKCRARQPRGVFPYSDTFLAISKIPKNEQFPQKYHFKHFVGLVKMCGYLFVFCNCAGPHRLSEAGGGQDSGGPLEILQRLWHAGALVHYCTLSLFDIWVTRQSAEWEPPISTGTL